MTVEEKKIKQAAANKRWAANNKERAKYLSDRSRTRSFINKQSSTEDLIELQSLINQRLNTLNPN
ncbi:hypothetical protein [Exiguobacterium sp. s78]|uniref:hypothetical protein n=1 Tax=Exiguobacterium sp. s78 TaxID=2751197 RepID=UPI001BECF304|nr:hypothetical protein [Exiguobacterium sp. s78]